LKDPKDKENQSRNTLTIETHKRRATISQQRKRILDLQTRVSQVQQLRLAAEPDEDSAPQTQILDSNESLSVLRNKLFTNRDEDREEVTDTSTEHVLQHHRMLQDDMSTAMLGMAKGLKDRSIAFGEALREDSKVSL
jgi:hypothetical protein